MVAEKVKLLAGLGIVLAAVNLAASIFFTRQFGLIGPVVGNLVAAGSIQLVPMIVLTRRFTRTLQRADDSQPEFADPDTGPRNE
jgi:hypothetical protein